MFRISIRDIFRRCEELRRKGFKTIDAHIGAPSHEPPIPVKKALEMIGDDTGRFYRPFVGIRELREEIARYMRRFIGFDASPDRVIVTGSGAHALFVTSLMFMGSKGLAPAPGFSHYYDQAELLGIRLKYYDPTSEDIVGEILGKLDGEVRFVIINYPHNPTGYYPEPDQLLTLYEELRHRGVILINDIVYHQIYYEEKPAFPGDILIDSFSKNLALPGLRLGYIYWGIDGLERAGKMVYWSTAGASDAAQKIILAMLRHLTDDYFDYVRNYYRPKQQLLVKLLREAGFQFPRPKGALYVLARHAGVKDAVELAWRLLREDRKRHVGIVPGCVFKGPKNSFRISYGFLSLRDIEEMVEELEEELTKHVETSLHP